jgi:prepilin-type N-terminal cleavage/methylation domain-containing protein
MKLNQKSLVRQIRGGFSLVELLVVVGIIVSVMALATKGIPMAMRAVAKMRATQMITSLQVATASYHTEYSRLPFDPSNLVGGSEDIDLIIADGNNPTINALMGISDSDQKPNLNSRKIKFYEGKLANDGVNGLINTDLTTATMAGLVDNWGTPIYFQFDSNYDEKVPNPDRRSADPDLAAGPEFLPTDCAIFSCGPDKQPFTADDVKSW